MRKQREANPNLDKEQYERKKINDPEFKVKLQAKNALAYQRRKARLAAQKIGSAGKGASDFRLRFAPFGLHPNGALLLHAVLCVVIFEYTMTPHFTVVTISVLLDLCNVATERAVDCVFLTTPPAYASAVEDMTTLQLITIPALTVRIFHLISVAHPNDQLVGEPGEQAAGIDNPTG